MSAPVLNGEDNREEWFQIDDNLLRERLRQQVAGVLWTHHLHVDEDQGSLKAMTLQDGLHVCADERFAEQPSAALCTATLIDDDLVLTAGHCLGGTLEAAKDRCRRLMLVFGYQLDAPSTLGPIDASDVYRCRQVIHHEHRTTTSAFRDLALIQLDRPAAGPPANVSLETLHAGDEVVLASHGAGLPLKIEQHATVLEVLDAQGYFRAATDSYAGGSGGALFNRDQQLVGHQVRGAVDWESHLGCLLSAHSDSPNEQHQSVQVAIDALCATGWPSATLCGTAPSCGDDFCTATEDSESCPEDCPATRCGDARCDRTEWQACRVDCDDYTDVPPDWSDDPQIYRQSLASTPVEDGGAALEGGASPAAGCDLHRGRKPSSLIAVALAWLVAAGRRRPASRETPRP